MALIASKPEAPFQPLTLRRFVVATWERRIPIGAFMAVVIGTSVTLALLAKPWFATGSTILPPSEGSDPWTNIAGLIESQALNRVGLFSTKTPSDVYVEILRSRRLRESLVKRFDLQRVYELRSMESTLKELTLHVGAKALPSGIVTVWAEDMDPRRAADMANFLVSELDRFNRVTLNTRGKSARLFLEARLVEAGQRMQATEAAMTQYERKHKVVLAGEESAVRGASDVMARKLSLQVQRAYVESYAPGSSGVREIDAELDAFNRELSRLPIVKNEGTRLAMEAEIQRKVFALLTAQLEQTRLEEMRDTPTVTVLDMAYVPEVRSRPKRTMMVATATLVAFAISMAWVWFSMRREAQA